MKVQITYINRPDSIKQAKQSLASFTKKGWDAELLEGVTPATLNENDFPYQDMENGRLASFKVNEPKKYPVKKSCLFNNLKFCQKVIELDTPMVFAEHDALCISSPEEWQFEEFLFLAFEYAFEPPTALAKPPFNRWTHLSHYGVQEFPYNYPLTYYKDNIYKNHIMTPGTAAYALTPKGASKILRAAERWGLEQSDFIINDFNVKMQYVYPSPVRYNKVNLNLSHEVT